MRILVFMSLAFLLSLPTIGQQQFGVKIQTGISILNASTSQLENSLPGFDARGTAGGNFLLSFRYDLGKNWYTNLGLGMMRLGMESEFMDVNTINYGSKSSRRVREMSFQVAGGIGKRLDFGNQGWGGFLALGISATDFSAKGLSPNTLESEEGMRGLSALFTNDQGETGTVMLHKVGYRPTEDQFIWHIRPEIGFFKRFGSHQIDLSYVRGLKVGEEINYTNFQSISYFNKYYSAGHVFNGSFNSIQLGYEFSF